VAECLVLGADGFIGSHLVDELLRRGHSVRAFDRLRNGSTRNLTPHDALTLANGDFLNRADLERAVEGAEFVFHFISTTTPATSGADPTFDVETNVRMSVELLTACVAAGVRRVIYPSTGGAIYGYDSPRPFREDELPRPVSPYAIGKLAVEGYLRFFQQAHGLDSLVLRVSNPYGERQNIEGAQGAIPIFLHRMLEREPITVYGDGSMVRDYLYVRDLARMIGDCFDQPAAHELYNVGSGEALSVLALLEVLEEVTGLPARTEHLPERATDVHRVSLDVSRFANEFGTARTPLADGIAATFEYVRQASTLRRSGLTR
jgi:UDP-glucose 4-epimerase